MQNVQDKVILITGASSGIGAATAKVLAAHGAKVVLSARRKDRLQQLVAEIGENAAYLASDVTRLDDMKALTALAKERFGKVDVLFGNAVYAGTKHFVRAMLDSFRTESVMENTNIRTTTIYPGAIKTELLDTIAPSETKSQVEAFYQSVGLEPDVIADAVLYAIAQPDNVDVSDLAIRPSKEG